MKTRTPDDPEPSGVLGFLSTVVGEIIKHERESDWFSLFEHSK